MVWRVMGAMRAIHHILAGLPLLNGHVRDPKLLRQDPLGRRRGLNLFVGGGGCPGIRLNLITHEGLLV